MQNQAHSLTLEKKKIDKDPNFEIDDSVKNIFAKCYVPNWHKEVFVIAKVKDANPWTHVIYNVKDEEIVGMFHENKSKRV